MKYPAKVWSYAHAVMVSEPGKDPWVTWAQTSPLQLIVAALAGRPLWIVAALAGRPLRTIPATAPTGMSDRRIFFMLCAFLA